MAKRKLPVPEFVTTETDYGTAYAWKCSGFGIMTIENTRLDSQVRFMEAFEAEYNKKF